MKRIVVILSTLLAAYSSLAQGMVNFLNNSATLVSVGQFGWFSPDSFFFGLLIAPAGTTNPLQFSFANVYATHISIAGRFFGGTGVAVPGWPANTTESFMVAGWSASLGHDWNQGWLSGDFARDGNFGLSGIATSLPGNFFGGDTGIQSGWNLAPVSPIPEPSSLVLGLVGLLMLLLLRLHSQGNPGRLAGGRLPVLHPA